MSYMQDVRKIEDFRKEWKGGITYHPPTSPEQIANHEQVNKIIEDAGFALLEVCPACDETRFALNALREARMWANAALAIYVNNPTPPAAPKAPARSTEPDVTAANENTGSTGCT